MYHHAATIKRLASENGHNDVVKFLLQNKASIKDNDGLNVLTLPLIWGLLFLVYLKNTFQYLFNLTNKLRVKDTQKSFVCY